MLPGIGVLPGEPALDASPDPVCDPPAAASGGVAWPEAPGVLLPEPDVAGGLASGETGTVASGDGAGRA